jgi:hypothetical protein
MLLDQVSETQTRAGQFAVGATMATVLAAPMVRSYDRPIRLVVAGFYLGGVLGLLLYVLL